MSEARAADAEGGRPDPRLIALCVLALAAAVFAAFAPALAGGFLDWDDNFLITANPRFRDPGSDFAAWAFRTGLMGHFQPLSWLSLGLDRALWGFEPPLFPGASGFHLTNLVLHALAAVAVFALALRLFDCAGAGAARARAAGAFCAALFFAVHPLRVESVAWITERRDVLSGLFFVLCAHAWLAYGRDRPAPAPAARATIVGAAASIAAVVLVVVSIDLSGNDLEWRGPGAFGLVLALVALAVAASSVERGARGRFALALALLLVSLLAKAWGIVMPVVLLVLDVWPLHRARGGGWRAYAGLVLEKLPFAALAIVFGRLASWAQGIHEYTQPALADHTPLERLAQAGYGLAFYPWKTLVPTALSPLYELPLDLPLASARFGPPLAIVAVLTLALFALRRRFPALLAAWIAYAAIVSPVLGVLQSGPQLVADRYSYLACLPFAFLLGGGLALCFERARWTLALALAACALLSALAWRQSALWRDNLTLWTWARACDPSSGEAAKQLGFAKLALAQHTIDPEAQRALYLETAQLLAIAGTARKDPKVFGNFALVHRALAVLEAGAEQQHRAAAIDFAARATALAREQGFATTEYLLNQGAILCDAGRFEEAVAIFQQAVDESPETGPAWGNLGVALLQSQRYEEAVVALEKAVELAPWIADQWANLAIARSQLGLKEPACEAARRALQVQPGHAGAEQVLRSLGC